MKLLTNGIAVIEGDTHISRWVEESNTIEIAKQMLAPFKKYVKPGDCVVDVGASIGDHTVTYAKWVGEDGLVLAFDPNPVALECLNHNTAKYKQIVTIGVALSDTEHWASLSIQENAGASYLLNQGTEFKTSLLDDFELSSLAFMKIDAEGYETRILRGAVETIGKFQPVMLIEVNHGALIRAGSSSDELRSLIESYGYSIEITDSRIQWSKPQFDIICLPINKAH